MDAFGQRSAGDCGAGQGDGARAEVAEGCGGGQHGLFGMFNDEPAAGSSANEDALPPAPEWDEHTRLQNEKEVLGFFVSGHPLDRYREKLRNLKVVDTATACEMKPEPQVFRRGQRAAERDPDCRRDYRAEGCEVEALGRDVCAGVARGCCGQDRADCVSDRTTRSSRRS